LVALKLFHVRDFISSNKDLFSGRMIDECLMTSCIHCVYMPELEANQDAVLVEKRTDD